MLSKLKKRNQSGFTIIEVMIVLAIAGLILLIVFLAVPALQRNARNTNRKNDVASLLSAVNEYVTNNNGNDPANIGTCSNGAVTFGNGTTSEAKVGYYNKGCPASGTTSTSTAGYVGYVAAAVPTGTTIPVLSSTAPNDWVNIYIGATCDATAVGQVDPGGARSVVAQFQIENGANKFATICQAS